ncbi:MULTISPECIES: hypothetical protein [unclassified Microcoleus]|uniref:hypothetical protein n=1 Tax=unclassified Microcoleus TaxID=2642155 RepID=UPI0025E923BB|nr:MULTISPECIES: hypothetical protein [unclassified Microcoleus]
MPIYIAIVKCIAAKNLEAPPTIKRATHHTQLVGCVATKNLEAPPTISQRRTAQLRRQRKKPRIHP